MTTLEILLCALLHILYGIYAISKTTRNGDSLYQEIMEGETPIPLIIAIFIMICAPSVLVYRALYGIFKSYKI